MSLDYPMKKAMLLRLMKWKVISCNTNENLRIYLDCKKFFSPSYICKDVITLLTAENDATKIDEVMNTFSVISSNDHDMHKYIFR